MAPSPSRLAVVLSTTATSEEAHRIAGLLIDEHLAACVQISGPITSLYRWQNAVETDTEYRLVIKTTLQGWPKVRDRLIDAHSYDEPQIILLPVEDASAGYQQWVCDQTGGV